MIKSIFLFLLAAVIFLGCEENIQSPDSSSLNKSALQKSYGNYSIHLSGSFEVPERNTLAQGQAIFRLSADGTELYYKLIVSNITNLFMTHIHVAPPGVNGGIAVWLYPQTPIPQPIVTPPDSWIEGRFSGVLQEGVITSADLVGPLAGMTLADLLENIENSNAYVNVHTSDFVDPANTGPGDFPGGEIRGDF